MLQQSVHLQSLVRVLLKDLQHEVLSLVAYGYVLRERYVLFYLRLANPYDLYQLLLAADLEWDVSDEQLVGEDAHRPNIDLVVVGLSFEDLRRDVQRRPAEGASQLRTLVDSPAEVAQLHDVLSKTNRT